MSVRPLNTQRSLFDTDYLLTPLFKTKSAHRFVLFREKIMPQLWAIRPKLEEMYCADNGRPAIEPTLLLAVLLLQFMERLPDRQAAEACVYDLRWKQALGLPIDAPGFHPSVLTYFRDRLLAHGLVASGFDAVLDAMREAGYLKKNKAQRLDSTHVFGLVSDMGRLECVSETIRLALEEIEKTGFTPRPEAWETWWERYTATRPDYRADVATLKKNMKQAGKDAQGILAWVETVPVLRELGPVDLLRRVFAENFEVRDEELEQTRAQPPGAVHNPHDPEANWSAKTTISGKKKDWVGYKAQIAETVPSEETEPNAPTDSVITAALSQPAISSDKAAVAEVEKEWAARGVEPPPAVYVDGGYTSAELLAQAQEDGRDLRGPVASSPSLQGRFTVEAFTVDLTALHATCPAGHLSSHCSRLEEGKTGKVSFRFEWNQSVCGSCALRAKCLGKDQRHRTIAVGEHHECLQARRAEMKTDAFRKEMHQRNGIEGTISELKRGHGLSRSRYRGSGKNQLQVYFICGACNIKRWSRRLLWEGQEGDLAGKSTLLGTVYALLKAFGVLFCFPRAASPLKARLLYGAP